MRRGVYSESVPLPWHGQSFNFYQRDADTSAAQSAPRRWRLTVRAMHVLAAAQSLSRQHLSSLNILCSILQVDGLLENGKTALLVACERGSDAFVERALELGANPNGLAGTDCFPLLVANSTRKVSLLLRHGADPRRQTRTGTTALHSQAYALRIGAVVQLLKHGADPTIADVSGATALFTAVLGLSRLDLRTDTEYGTKIVHLLLEAGISPWTASRFARNSLHVALQAELPQITRLLLRYGADPNSEDLLGRPACFQIPPDTEKGRQLLGILGLYGAKLLSPDITSWVWRQATPKWSPLLNQVRRMSPLEVAVACRVDPAIIIEAAPDLVPPSKLRDALALKITASEVDPVCLGALRVFVHSYVAAFTPRGMGLFRFPGLATCEITLLCLRRYLPLELVWHVYGISMLPTQKRSLRPII